MGRAVEEKRGRQELGPGRLCTSGREIHYYVLSADDSVSFGSVVKSSADRRISDEPAGCTLHRA